MHSAGDLAMFLGDYNGHIGRHIDGFLWGSMMAWHRSEEF